MTRAHYLGIDAGNTKTVAVLADHTGQVVGFGRSGGANIYVDHEAALTSLDHAVGAALRAASVTAEHVHATTLSAAGADWPEDFEVLAEALRARGWGERRQVVNDAIGALHAGIGDAAGVAVVCGTSAGIAARGPDGRTWHSSYWQEPEGAEELGQRTLRAVYRAALGIDPGTTLTARVLHHYALPDPEALLHAFTARHAPLHNTPVGALARLLLDEAQRGDPVSVGIVTHHGRALGDYVLAAARQVGLSGAYPVVTSGGVMRHPSPALRGAMMRRIHEDAPLATELPAPHEPVFGAVLLSFALAQLPATDARCTQLGASMPAPAFFHT